MLAIILVALSATIASASTTEVNLYVDAAPNVYGSPAYAPWEANTFASIAAGSFVNMSNGINPDNYGTTNFEIQDEVVYSFGDLGKRLTWIYYIKNETVSSLTDRISVKLENVWDGDYLDFYDDYYGSTWLTPSKIYNYDADNDGTTDGVFGLAGMAWWPDATQEAVDAAYESWGASDETWTFTVKLDGQDYDITSVREAIIPVPAPGALLLAGLGTAIAGRFRRRA